MKLLNLTLCNLASFEGEHVIDFSAEPLAGADLFSIVGETGSGKSTILDALLAKVDNTLKHQVSLL